MNSQKTANSLVATAHHAGFIAALLIAVLSMTQNASQAAVIDFEQINMDFPHEGLAISNQFEPYFGVRFRRNNTGNKALPVICRIGYPLTGFERDGTVIPSDTPVDAYTNLIGNFMLTDTVGEEGGKADVQLIMEYTSLVSRVSGYIVDIDAGESVQIRAYADTNALTLLTNVSIVAGQTGTGDGVATFWQIVRATNQIRRVDIYHSAANGTDGAKLGFDRFDSDYLPPLTSASSLGLKMLAGVTIQGQIGRRYQIDYADKLDIIPGNTNWHILITNLFLPTTNYLFIDTNAPATQRFYRAAAMP